MATHVLVVDANTAFATMLQQALQDQRGCQVALAVTAAEAVALAAKTAFDLAIVDMGLPDVSGGDAVRGLRAARPHLAVIAIPFNTDPGDPELQALDVQGFLTKPFFLPTLDSVVEEALSRPVGGVAPARPAKREQPEPEPASPPVPQTPAPAWLEDRAAAARRLEALLRRTAAGGALLVHGSGLIARAGEYPGEAFDRMGEIVQAHLARDRRGGQGTLMRFVKVASSGLECLLFAMPLAPDLMLALVFQADVPISKVRRQAREAADALLQQAPAGGLAEAARPAPTPRTDPARRGKVETQTIAPSPEWIAAALPRSRPASLPAEVVVDQGLELSAETSPAGLTRTPHALYNLTYVVLWAPKFPKTRLVGNIAGLLDEWIRHIALSHDWRVERVQVQPECVAVVVSCPPETAPERLVNTLKRLTSERAFAEFPSLASDHSGGDLWAPGYFLQAGGQAPTPQQIDDFLAYTRREQGLRR
jgi:putative transposase